MSKVLELLLNEGSGAVATDTSGYGNNADTNARWLQLTTGKWVLTFDGETEWLRCDKSPSLNIYNLDAKVTIETWVNMTQDKSTMWLGTGWGGSDGGYALYYHQPFGKVCGYIEGVGVEGDPEWGWHANPYSQAIAINKWYHIVYTFDGQYGRIYVNGNLEARSDEWLGGMFSAESPYFQVFQGFAGMIGNIGIYDHALSESDIKANFLAEAPNYGYEVPTELTIYVTSPITDQKILPDSVISQEYISNLISLDGSPGEYRPATFTIYTPTGVANLEVIPSNLIGPTAAIPGSNIDIRAVKCWYQAGVSIYDVNHKLLTPELLLKDDSLVKVESEENYLKLTSGEYIWISEVKSGTGEEIIPIEEFPVKDSPTLQPVNIPAGTNKQFWVTIKIPEGTPPGTYNGTIKLEIPGEGVIAELQLRLEVLPIELSEPYLTYSLYYRGKLHSDWPNGSISSEYKSETQLRAELENMFNHGVMNPTVYQSFDDLGRVLAMRDEVSMGGQPLYYLGLKWGYPPISEVGEVIALAQSYGIPEVYFYGKDEATSEALIAQRESWQAIHGVGGKIFAAGYTAIWHPPGNFELVGDIQDLLICAGKPSAQEAAKWHSVGHKIFCYANPQVGEERPETYRRNYGLLLWQKDYDGAMDYAYQHSFGNIWNDFDDATYRDHVFAYPTIDGVIDTIEWEGWREGVTDVRYLTTLLNTIETAKSQGIDTTAAENYLAGLKTASLSNLDQIRQDIIAHILYLQGEPIPPPPPPINEAWLVGGVLTVIITAAAIFAKKRRSK